MTRLKEESGAPGAHVIPSPADGQSDATTALRSGPESCKGRRGVGRNDGDGLRRQSRLADAGLGRPPDRGQPARRAAGGSPQKRAKGSWKPAQCRVRSWSQARTALASAKPCAVGCTATSRLWAGSSRPSFPISWLCQGSQWDSRRLYGSDCTGSRFPGQVGGLIMPPSG